MSPRLLIVLVALLVVLFCVGTGMGACGDGGGGGDATWPDRLASWFISEQPLPAADVEAGACLRNGVFEVAPGPPCTARIAASDSYLRTARLRLLSGGEVDVSLQPEGEGAVVKRRLSAGSEPLKLQVFRGGARLTLQFRSGGGLDRCRVELR